jgi:predicted metal-dependent peptidase
VPTDGKGEEPIDTGGCGGFEAPDPKDPESTSPEKLEEEWRQELIKSKIIQSSLKRGDIPASAQREIDRINSVRVDWRNAMTEFVRSLPSGRNDWTRSARRHALAPTIVPRRKRDEVGLVVYLRDVSGSVDDKVFAEFTGLIGQACENTGGDAIVIDADAAVQAEYRITRGDLIPTTGTGGGGTDFRPAFARVQELIGEGENIAGVVYLTDLYGTQPEPDMVTVPTLWLVTNAQVATTGTTVQVHL